MTLVYVEHQNGVVDEPSLQAVAVARRLAGDGPVHALTAGPGAAGAAAAAGFMWYTHATCSVDTLAGVISSSGEKRVPPGSRL